MEHKHVHGKSWPDLNECDQNLGHSNVMPQQTHHDYASNAHHIQARGNVYGMKGWVGSSESNRVPHPVENRSIDHRPMLPNWNHSAIPNRFTFTRHNIGIQHHQPVAESLHHPYPPLPVGGYPPTFPSFYGNGPSYVYPSSNSDPPSFYDDLRMGGRGSYKRKSPAFPFVDESGSTSRYDGAGSSSSGHIYPNFVQKKPYFDSTRQWEYHAIQTDNHVSSSRPVVDEGATRNVRRRYAFDVEANSSVSGSYVQSTRPVIHPSGCSIPMESAHWMPNSVNSDWRHVNLPPAAPGVMPIGDLRNSSQGSNLVLCGSSATNFSSEARGYQIYFNGNRNPFGHQSSFENLTRPTQMVHCYSQQYPQSTRNTHNAFDVGPSYDNTQIVSENYFSTRHPRPYRREVFVPTGRDRGPRILHERRRFLPGDISGRDGRMPEGFIDVDQSAMQGFHNLYDQHSDMRFDIDNMTYEELLALGERIGNVCTGLSDDAVSKCLMESVYHYSSNQVQEEEICAVCLEEYKKMETVGTLRGCGHGYHSSCIKKWLSMKNSCPICKTPGQVADKLDDKLGEAVLA